VSRPFFIFLKADTALYIGYISSNSLFTEENEGLEAHTGLYQPLKKKNKIKKGRLANRNLSQNGCMSHDIFRGVDFLMVKFIKAII
jgi:hypothetical protein